MDFMFGMREGEIQAIHSDHPPTLVNYTRALTYLGLLSLCRPGGFSDASAADTPEDRNAVVSSFSPMSKEASPEALRQRVFKRGAGGDDDGVEEEAMSPSNIITQDAAEEAAEAQRRQVQERYFKRGNKVYEEHGGSDGEKWRLYSS